MSVYDLYTKKKNDRRGKGNCRLDFNRANSTSISRERGFPEATLLDKTDGKSRPPKSRMEKWRVLAFTRASSLIWWGMGVCCSILFLLIDCIYHHVKENSILYKNPVRILPSSFNPLSINPFSPNIYIQILQTDLYTFC